MPEQQIILTIDKEGQITAKTHGFKGETCIDALADLLDQELNISSVKKTDEYFQQNELKQSSKIELRRGGK